VICNAGDVAVVPFPFSERPGTKRRPALTLSDRRFNQAGHTILAMITTKTHSPWPGDQPIRREFDCTPVLGIRGASGSCDLKISSLFEQPAAGLVMEPGR